MNLNLNLSPLSCRVQMAEALADCLLSFRLLKVGGMLIIDDETNFEDVALATATLERALGNGLQILHRKVYTLD